MKSYSNKYKNMFYQEICRLNEFGVDVQQVPTKFPTLRFDGGTAYGKYLLTETIPTILIRQDLNYVTKLRVLLHEEGHWLCHKNYCNCLLNRSRTRIIPDDMPQLIAESEFHADLFALKRCVEIPADRSACDLMYARLTRHCHNLKNRRIEAIKNCLYYHDMANDIVLKKLAQTAEWETFSSYQVDWIEDTYLRKIILDFGIKMGKDPGTKNEI